MLLDIDVHLHLRYRVLLDADLASNYHTLIVTLLRAGSRGRRGGSLAKVLRLGGTDQTYGQETRILRGLGRRCFLS